MKNNTNKLFQTTKRYKIILIFVSVLVMGVIVALKLFGPFPQFINIQINWLLLLPVFLISTEFKKPASFFCVVASIALSFISVGIFETASFNLFLTLFVQGIIFLLVGILVNIQGGEIRKLKKILKSQEKDITKESRYRDEVLETLLRTVDAKDSYTYKHSQRVAYYAKILATNAGICAEETDKIFMAAKLHDIGKIGMKDKILNKSEKLSDLEFVEAKEHVIIGARIAKNLEYLQDIVPIIKHHHERYDGKGYPEGLLGDKIPLGSRIIAICDSFDAMTSDREYHKGISVEEAVKSLMNNIGTQYDPSLCILFADIINISSNLHPDIVRKLERKL